jgi:hypothetical protein
MCVYINRMSQKTTPQSLLQQMARINRMEPGKLCIIRQGPDGPYYNLQCREKGKTVTRYVPRDQAQQVAQHTANHERFQALVEQYIALIANLSRAERETGLKKRSHAPAPSGPRPGNPAVNGAL